MRSIISIAFALAGCGAFQAPATPEQEAAAARLQEHGPVGAQTAECQRPASCYEEARETCPHGYDRVDSAQDVLPGGGVFPATIRTTLVYECRHPERRR